MILCQPRQKWAIYAQIQAHSSSEKDVMAKQEVEKIWPPVDKLSIFRFLQWDLIVKIVGWILQ